MDILLDDQEEQVLQAVRDFLQQECTISTVRNAEKSPSRISELLWAEFCDLGWLGLCLPESVGGQGLPVTYLGLLLEEHGRYMAPLPTYSTLVAATVLAKYGSNQQTVSLLPEVVRGSHILTFAITEKEGVWGRDSIGLQALRRGPEFELTGEKYFVGHARSANQCLVAARICEEGRESSHVSLILVDMKAAGVSIHALSPMAKDDESVIRFDRVRISEECVIGSLSDSNAFDDLLDVAAVLLACQMGGAARRATEMAVEYVKERDAFGQPIAAFQAIQHMAADMLNGVDGTQLLSREALWRMSEGLPASVEASQAKAFANVHCVMACRSSQQMHGGIGFIAEFDLNLWYRRVISWSLRAGTTREHRARVASAILRKDGPARLGMPMYLPQEQEALVLKNPQLEIVN